MGKAQFHDRYLFILMTSSAFLVSGIASTETVDEIKKEIRDSFHEFDKHYSMKIHYANHLDDDADLFWKNMEIEENATKLSDDKFVNGKAIVELPFKFKLFHINYYSVSVTKEGTILSDEDPDAWIITPLMARVGMARCNVSYLKQGDNFYVQWNNFRFNHDKFGEHEFSFQFRLSARREIEFVYRRVPYNLTDLRKNCDYCLEDKFGVMYPHQEFFKVPPYNETYELGFPMDFQKYEVKQGTVVKFVKADSCMEEYECYACTNAKFQISSNYFGRCLWCPAIQKCSSTRDSLRHVWKENQCDIYHGSDPHYCFITFEVTDLSYIYEYKWIFFFILLTVMGIICISTIILFKDEMVKICCTIPSDWLRERIQPTNQTNQPVDNNQEEDKNNNREDQDNITTQNPGIYV